MYGLATLAIVMQHWQIVSKTKHPLLLVVCTVLFESVTGNNITARRTCLSD
jgi:hypothetical protein